MNTLVIFSGGLDSTVLVYGMCEWGTPTLLSFDYGQRHIKEVEYAKSTAVKLGLEHIIIDLTSIAPHLTGSYLTDTAIDTSVGVSTIVPNRNAIMLAIAFGIAFSREISLVAIGVNETDEQVYPDCRGEFIDAFWYMQTKALETEIELYTPLLNMSKLEIVMEANRLEIPLKDTWSCYTGGNRPCNECGACKERQQAIKQFMELDK